MLLAFLDESNNSERHGAALVCAPEIARLVTEPLGAVCVQAANDYGARPIAELHGYDLLHAGGGRLKLGTDAEG